MSTFERLLYTDCASGQGRGSGNGFQVQAESSGVEPDLERLAVDKLLYAIQERWINQLPVEAFPPGFAHAATAQGYGTGQSLYLGKEVMGGRMGNHLADCLLTRNAESYGIIRPAQLYGAAFWRRTPWEGTVCPRFEDFLEPGPLDTDTVAEWLRAEPQFTVGVKRLASFLETPGARSAAILADDPQQALMWIAASTMLIPSRRALGISFKVFSAQPQRSDHRICGFPKELFGDNAAARFSGWFLLDASTGSCSEHPVLPGVSEWVDLLAGTSDPYEVIEAIELEDELAPSSDGSERDLHTQRTAWSLALSDASGRSASLARWLRMAPEAVLGSHGAKVVDLILDDANADITNPADLWRWIDAKRRERLLPTDGARIRPLLLQAEITEARSGQLPPEAILDPVAVSAAMRADATSLLGSVLLVESEPVVVNALLRVARRHGVELPWPSLRQRIHEFLVSWIAHPGPELDPDLWPLDEPLVDLIHQELSYALRRSPAASFERVFRKVWRLLESGSQDLTDPLTVQVLAARMADAPAERRLDMLFEALRSAQGSPARAEIVAGIQKGLLSWGLLGEAEAIVIVGRGGERVPLERECVRLALHGVARQADRPTAAALDALNMLHVRHRVARDHPLAELADASWRMSSALWAGATSATPEHLARHQSIFDTLTLVDERVIVARLPEAAEIMIGSRNYAVGYKLMRPLREEVSLALLRSVAHIFPKEAPDQGILNLLVWSTDTTLSSRVRQACQALIQQVLSEMDDAQRVEVTQRVSSLLTYPEIKSAWDAVIKPSRSIRGILSRDRKP